MTRRYSFRLPRVLYAPIAFICLVVINVPAWAQFETRAIHGLPGETFGMVTGDFNHDGKMDIAVTGNYLSILLGNGDGTFQPPVNYTGVGNWIAVADFNNDGNLDLITANGDNSVSVFLGNGDGTFQSAKNSYTTGDCTFVVVGDFNGDHKLDIAVVDNPYISVLLGNGDGTFQAPIDNSSFVGGHQLAVGDFNNDHHLDVAVAGFFGGSQDFGILLGNGDGTLQAALTYPLLYVPDWVSAADFNRDGNMDLVIGYEDGGLSVLLGSGDGSFRSDLLYSLDTGGPISVADFNGDGNLDLVVGAGPAVEIAELLGNGDGTFKPRFYLSGTGGAPIYGDFNGDGKLDLALWNGLHAKFTTMLNTGALDFSPSAPISFPVQLVKTSSRPEIVTLTNTGRNAISIRSLTISGEFQANHTCGSSITAGGRCTITAIFEPKTAGGQSGLITLVDSASAKPQIIELSGHATALKASPNSLIFQSQKVGSRSSPQDVTLTNQGDVTLSFSSINIAGSAGKDFSETNTCLSEKFSPGRTCTIAVTFDPTKTGTRAATLYINLKGSVSPQPMPLTGSGN